MASFESAPAFSQKIEQKEAPALPGFIAEAFREAAVERKHSLLERLARKLRIAATVCMLGLAAGAAAQERAGSAIEEEGLRVFTAENLPTEMPSTAMVVEALMNGSGISQGTDSGTWHMEIANDRAFHAAADRWIVVGKKVHAIALAEAAKLPQSEREALVRNNTGFDTESGALAEAGAAISKAYSEAADEFGDDEDDPLMQFVGKAELTLWEQLEPQERADALNKLVADAQELGVVLTWSPDEP
ncbi:MAG: hypothetical protein IT406_02945 [Candidatus Yanofskybacteria bacterium]|nr:hypothetical protein [Candidatus Yanofskybacteria bacterium]